MRKQHLEAQLKALPAKPGVYVFRARGRPSPLHRQGEVAPAARALLLPGDAGHPRTDRAAARPSRRHRGDRHRNGGRGAPRGAEPGQAPPAAVQHPLARRQVVPIHRGHDRGRVPARHVHARAAPPRRSLLRALRQREEGARDPRRAQPGLPVPALRGAEARAALGDPVPRLPHRALQGALRRLRLEGGVRRADRPRDRVPLGRDEAGPARARTADASGQPAKSASRTPPATATVSMRSATSPSVRRPTVARSARWT